MVVATRRIYIALLLDALITIVITNIEIIATMIVVIENQDGPWYPLEHALFINQVPTRHTNSFIISAIGLCCWLIIPNINAVILKAK